MVSVKLFKSTISPDTLESIFIALQGSLATNQKDTLRVLRQMAKLLKKLKVAFKCMSQQGKGSVQNIINMLESVDDEDSSILQGKYKKIINI